MPKPESGMPEGVMVHRPPQVELPVLPWYERLNILNVTFVLFLLVFVFSLPDIQGSSRSIDYWASIKRFFGDFFPPDFSVLGDTLKALLQTIKIAVVATFFAILISFPLAAMGAQNLAPRWLVVAVRLLMNGIRTVPSLIWAVIAVAILGGNSLAGVVALTFYSMGYLGKFFSEAFESVDLQVARGMRSLGADPVQAFQYGVWPHAKPLIWSYSLWMLEYNIRSATIIGYVGVGGLGAQLFAYQEFNRWDRFCTVLICIFVVVTLLDFLGEVIRNRVTQRMGKKALSES